MSTTLSSLPPLPNLFSFLSIHDLINSLLITCKTIRNTWQNDIYQHLLIRYFHHHTTNTQQQSKSNIFITQYKTRLAWSLGRSAIPTRLPKISTATTATTGFAILADGYPSSSFSILLEIFTQPRQARISRLAYSAQFIEGKPCVSYPTFSIRSVAFGGGDSFVAITEQGTKTAIISQLNNNSDIDTSNNNNTTTPNDTVSKLTFLARPTSSSIPLITNHTTDILSATWSSCGNPQHVSQTISNGSTVLLWDVTRPDTCVQTFTIPIINTSLNEYAIHMRYASNNELQQNSLITLITNIGKIF
jgi:hypothetical protein